MAENGTDPEAPNAETYSIPIPKLAFEVAPDLADLADGLIEEHDELFKHLKDYTITYLWKQKGGKTKRQNKRVGVQITGQMLRHFAKCTFIVWLAADHGATEKWTPKQVEALVFSALLQMGEDQKRGGPLLVAPDFAGFRKEIEEYGAWNDSLRALQSTMEDMKQLGLGLEAKVAVPA